MGAISFREALRGPWSFNATGWLVLLLPMTMLAVVQDAATPFPHFGYVLISALAQHLAAGLLSAPIAALLRRRRGFMPIWAIFTVWGAIGMVRGLVGWWLATPFESDGSLALRLGFWVAVTLAWMPIAAYTAAQLESRRTLLGRIAEATSQRESARQLRSRSAQSIRSQLLSTIDTAVTNVIVDTRMSLSDVRFSVGTDQFRSAAARLTVLSRQVADVLGQHTQPGPASPRSLPRGGAALMSALIFERQRPWVWGILSMTLLFATLAPMSVRLKDWVFLLQLGSALVAAAIALALGLRFVPKGLELLSRQIWWLIARYGAAGFTGGLLLSTMRWGGLDSYTTSLIVFLPYGIAYSALVVSGPIGLAAANMEAVRALAGIESERDRDETAASDDENLVRDQLSHAMHGPILGRLSACVMALNFHADNVGTVSTEHTIHIARTVQEHLESVGTEIEVLRR